VEAAAGDVVAFLDDDAQAAPDWLAHLEGAYGHVAVMAVGGAVEPAWPEGRPAWFPPEFDWVVGCTHSGMPGERASVRNLVGANMSFRRDVLLALGGFSERLGRVGTLPAGCEETELCIRARQHWPERSILYLPEARVRHSIAPERASKAYFAARCREEGRSKALVRGLVGPEDGLAAERAYVRRTLPAGVARGLARRDLGRPVAIVAGLALTAGSYIRAARLRAVPCGS
jgi:GT2 family glycosyltransferase